MIHKVYVSGPMRGYSQFNFPAFHLATAKLRAAGHEVFNPAERDETSEEQGRKFSIREALADDCLWICENASALFMLKGWDESKGAQAERALAEAIGGVVIWYQKGAVRS